MKPMAFLGCGLVLAAALAGCTTAPPAEQGGTATSVAITSFPSDAAPNSNATVCWRVAGSGRVPHTALHFDNTSHPSAQSFTEYDGGAAYPGNATAQVEVQLPGDFCSRVPVGTGSVYLRAHVIDGRGGNGMLSDEARINVRGATPNAILGVRFEGTPPATAPAGSNVTVCWNVTGTGRIPHTAVHSDSVSHPTATAFSVYAGAAFYPGNATGQVDVDLPGTFCSAVRMPANGTIYLRAHAMIQPPGQISPTEASIAVENATTGPGVATTIDWAGTVLGSAAAGSNFTACWRVEGTGPVPHTAIHTDDESHAGDATATFVNYDKAAYYPDNATAQATVQLPGTFCTSVTVPDSGNLYLRAHVIDSLGAPGRMSPTEKAVAIAG